MTRTLEVFGSARDGRATLAQSFDHAASALGAERAAVGSTVAGTAP